MYVGTGTKWLRTLSPVGCLDSRKKKKVIYWWCLTYSNTIKTLVVEWAHLASLRTKTQMPENSERDRILVFFYCKMHHISTKWTCLNLTKWCGSRILCITVIRSTCCWSTESWLVTACCFLCIQLLNNIKKVKLVLNSYLIFIVPCKQLLQLPQEYYTVARTKIMIYAMANRLGSRPMRQHLCWNMNLWMFCITKPFGQHCSTWPSISILQVPDWSILKRHNFFRVTY